MSIDETGYLRGVKRERDKLRDGTIPKKVPVTSKPQTEKLCTFCKRDMMESYLRPPNRFLDENGLDNGGMKPNHWYFKCPTCGLTDLMPTQQETTKRGYRTKNTVVNSLPMQIMTITKKRKPSGLSEEDKSDIYRAFGATDGVSLVDEKTTYTDTQGAHY
jgi:hypothetical protein